MSIDDQPIMTCALIVARAVGLDAMASGAPLAYVNVNPGNGYADITLAQLMEYAEPRLHGMAGWEFSGTDEEKVRAMAGEIVGALEEKFGGKHGSE